MSVLEAAKAEGNLAGVLAAVDRAQKGVGLMGALLSSANAARSIEAGSIERAREPLPEWMQVELRALGERYAREKAIRDEAK